MEFEGVGLRIGRHELVHDLRLRVEPGSLLGLIGRSGAGKTTTLRLLLGLIRPSRGTVRVLGRAPRSIHRIPGSVTAALDPAGLDPALRALDQVRWAARLFRASPRRDQAENTLARVGLDRRAHHRCAKLSQGERQRLALACALVVRPRLLVLDEPLTHLDPATAWQVMEVLRSERDAGVTIVCSSHHLAHVEDHADAVAFLREGRIVRQGRVEELLRGANPWIRVSAASGMLREVVENCAAVSTVRACDEDPSTVEVQLEGGSATDLNRHCHESGVTLSRLEPVQPGLEDLFRALERGEDPT